ncbi:MAG TPA: ATP-binding cassette domain-containing protein [Steroidobacteraceae bacterium]|nr:ATP-binding cassette domain-containing protein [Steroidobacteraceae bacterium]
MIEVHGLTKRFGTVEAVRDVGFVAQDGRITGLLGPNGAGKSTTLRIIATVLRPDAGWARIDGFDTHADSLAARRRLGVLPHASGLYPNLTARENIEFYGRLHGLGEAQLAARIAELVELLEIEEFAERRAKGFSQGQRIKVALARALISDPQNVILDEPTNGLDVMSIRALRALIARLRDSGRCVLFSSHVMQEVAALCDEIVIIGHGRVVAQGTPEKILEASGAATLEDAFVHAVGLPGAAP